MRWDIFLFFAGAVVTALAVKFADQPWLWDGTIYAGIAGMVASICHGILKAIIHQRARTMVIMIGMVLSGVAFLAFSAFYMRPGWFGLAPVTQNQNDMKTKNRFDNTILVRCIGANFSSEVPPDGSWLELAFYDDAERNSEGLENPQGLPGNAPQENYGPPAQFKCVITNFQKDPIFKVRLTLKYEMQPTRRVKGQDGKWENYGNQMTGERTVELNMIQAGQATTFWISNYTESSLAVYVPGSISFVPLGENAPVTARLIEAIGSRVTGAFPQSLIDEFRFHRVSRPPSPAPQGQPKGK